MEITPAQAALRRSQVRTNPLKTLVPVNASRNRVVDKNIDLLVFSWQQHQRGRTFLPPITHPTPPTNTPLPAMPFPALHMGSNSLIPFYTVVKPTCGIRFSWETDHKHCHIGIPSSNPVMWRC